MAKWDTYLLILHQVDSARTEIKILTKKHTYIWIINLYWHDRLVRFVLHSLIRSESDPYGRPLTRQQPPAYRRSVSA